MQSIRLVWRGWSNNCDQFKPWLNERANNYQTFSIESRLISLECAGEEEPNVLTSINVNGPVVELNYRIHILLLLMLLLMVLLLVLWC